jgi:hypothetical protein
MKTADCSRSNHVTALSLIGTRLYGRGCDAGQRRSGRQIYNTNQHTVRRERCVIDVPCVQSTVSLDLGRDLHPPGTSILGHCGLKQSTAVPTEEAHHESDSVADDGAPLIILSG